MRGHEAIRQMRLHGAVPVSVWIDDDSDDYSLDSHPSKGWTTHTARACVEVLPTDNPRTLDLRFLAGMTVHLQSRSEARMRALIDTAMSCGAKRVIGSVTTGDQNRASVQCVLDTDNTATWDKHGAAAA